MLERAAPRAARSALWASARAPGVERSRPCRRHACELRPIGRGGRRGLADLDAPAEVRAAIDPFGEHLPADRAALRAYERRLVGHPGFLAAVERRSGALVGWFQFEETTGAPASASSATGCAPTRGARATPPRAPRRCCAEAFAHPGIARVYAHSLLDNPASIRVMEKIGMSYAGPWTTAGCPGAEYEALAPSGRTAP